VTLLAIALLLITLKFPKRPRANNVALIVRQRFWHRLLPRFPRNVRTGVRKEDQPLRRQPVGRFTWANSKTVRAFRKKATQPMRLRQNRPRAMAAASPGAPVDASHCLLSGTPG